MFTFFVKMHILYIYLSLLYISAGHCILSKFSICNCTLLRSNVFLKMQNSFNCSEFFFLGGGGLYSFRFVFIGLCVLFARFCLFFPGISTEKPWEGLLVIVFAICVPYLNNISCFIHKWLFAYLLTAEITYQYYAFVFQHLYRDEMIQRTT